MAGSVTLRGFLLSTYDPATSHQSPEVPYSRH